MTKNDRIYDLIIARLLDRHYAFGEPILVKALVAETGVSRQPVMAALGKLHSDGFVRIIPQVGCEVIDPSSEQIADFFLMFERMEGLLGELAAMRRSDRQLRELRIIQNQMRMAHARSISPRDYREINREFYQMIHAMAHSPLLDDRQRSNFNMSDFLITQTVGFEAFMADADCEHGDITAFLDKRDPAGARRVCEAHVAAIRRTVLAGLPDADGVQPRSNAAA